MGCCLLELSTVYFIFSKTKNKTHTCMQKCVKPRVSLNQNSAIVPVTAIFCRHSGDRIDQPDVSDLVSDRRNFCPHRHFNTYKYREFQGLYIACLCSVQNARVLKVICRRKFISENHFAISNRHVFELVPESHALRSRL